MSLLSLVTALLLEQWRPLADRRYLYSLLARYATFLEGFFNAGETRQGVIAWVIAVLPVVLGAWLVYAAAYRAHPLLALVLNVAALYLTMGFRQRSHYFTAIHLALKENDLEKARETLSAWRNTSCADLDREAIARLAIEEALISSHRYVFAVVFWFVLLPGPTGAILYRLSMFLNGRWGERTSPELEALQPFCAPRVRRARLAAGAFHCGRFRGRGRLRGCGVLLAHAGRKLAGSRARNRPCEWSRGDRGEARDADPRGRSSRRTARARRGRPGR